MPINLNNALGIHEAALRLRGLRTELLASNLANADTPNYKARDVDFKAVLGEYQARQDGTGLLTTDARHIPTGADAVNAEPQYRVPTQPAIDGNTVDAQKEKASFMENALQYQASLHFIDGTFKTLRTAIRGD
jgi:flagellar basal-body rod protein FlgB